MINAGDTEQFVFSVFLTRLNCKKKCVLKKQTNWEMMITVQILGQFCLGGPSQLERLRRSV